MTSESYSQAEERMVRKRQRKMGIKMQSRARLSCAGARESITSGQSEGLSVLIAGLIYIRDMVCASLRLRLNGSYWNVY